MRQFPEDCSALNPSEQAVRTHINRARYLTDNPVEPEVEKQKEKGFYLDSIAANK